LSAVTVPEEADIADVDPLRMIEAELVILLSEAPAIASKQRRRRSNGHSCWPRSMPTWAGWSAWRRLKLHDRKHKTVSNSLVGSR